MNPQLTELKAKAYDLISALEAIQYELQKVNSEIAKAQSEKKDEPGDSTDSDM